jgi:hypothetical protein
MQILPGFEQRCGACKHFREILQSQEFSLDAYPLVSTDEVPRRQM